MKILMEYTWNSLKKNRKNTISIMIAVTIATILLSTMVLATYMNWNHDINKAILRNGNYHGSFYSGIDKSQIPYLKENQKVDEVYLRSEYYSGKIDTKRPYFNISYLNKEYWENMYEKNFILEGRIPEKSDEIVVIGNFLKENPQYKIGDKIKVNLGYREKEGKNIDPFDFIGEGETFIGGKEKEYTIVAAISGKSLSYEPYYGGLGFLDEDSIDEDMKLFPFLRMENPRSIYKDLPEIGRMLGFAKGEAGDSHDYYGSSYNLYYLRLQGIFPPSLNLWERVPESTLIFSIFILFVILLFVIIIYNVFTVWSNNRLRQLGILKSIGATPKQIKSTIVLEAIFISIVPIIIGVILGHLFCYIIIDIVNSMIQSINLDMNGSMFNLVFKTSPIVIGLILILSFLAILISISRPAKKLSKILPIEAIKYGGLDYEHLRKKKRKVNNYSPSNIISSLAKDFLDGNKKAFKTTIISITISFVIMFVFLTFRSLNQAITDLDTEEYYYSMQTRVLTREPADENIFKEIRKIDEVNESITYKNLYLYSKAKLEYESDGFKDVGGFEGIDIKKYPINKLEDGYEIPVVLTGIENEDFNRYIKSQGEEPEEYYNRERPKAILLNLVKEDINQPLARTKFIPYLHEEVNNISINEYKNQKGYTLDIDIGLKTFEKPIKDYYLQDYRIYLFMPKEVLYSIIENFDLPGDYSYSEIIRLAVDKNDIEGAKEKIKDIMKYYLPESDYYIWNILDDEAERKMQNKLVYLITFSIIFFLSIIGISNAYSSINNNLRNRRREFAMLKSMGITKNDLGKMLRLEGIYYSIYPFIISIPLFLIFLAFVVKINKTYTFKDLIIFLDYRIIIGYVIVIFMSIYLAYYFGIKKVERDEIVDVLKDESL